MIKMDPYKIIKYPLSTEKSIRLMESENKLIFVVDKNSNKALIRNAIEKMFDTKVDSIKTFISNDGKKKAYIKFAKDKPAIDIATQLGLI